MAGCFERVLAELNGKQELGLDEKSLKAIVERIEKIRETSGADANKFGMKVAEFLRRIETQLASERKNTILDKVKRERLKQYIGQFDPKDYGKAIRETMSGATEIREGGNLSVERIQNVTFDKWSSGLERDLYKQGLWEAFSSGSLDREITTALSYMDKTGKIDMKHADVKALPKEAIEMAKSVRKNQNLMVADLNRSGALIEEIDGYIIRQSHDGNKILGKKDEWKLETLQRLDIERTFGDLDDVKVDKALDDLYDDFTNGHHENFLQQSATDIVTRITKGGNLAERLGRSRSLHFKPGDHFFEYNKKYGRNTLAEGILRAHESNARAYGLLEKFGSNPRTGFDSMITNAAKSLSGNKEALEKFAGGIEKTLRENQWKELNGRTTVFTKNAFSNFASVATTLSGVTKLGMAAPRSITDLSTAPAIISSVTGENYLQVVGKTTSSYMKMLPSKNRSFWARELGFSIDSINKTMLKSSGIENGPGWTSKINDKYYKFIGLSQHTEAVKLGTARIVAVDMAESAKLGYGSLHETYKANLKRYNIGEGEFDVFRQAIKQLDADGSGSKLVTPDSIDELPLEAFAKAKELNGTKVSLTRYKADLIQNYSIYMQDIARFAITEPGVAEKALMKQGLSPDVPLGAVLRVAMQFKSFPLASVRNLFRVAQSTPGMKFDGMAVAKYMSTSMALAYMADSLIEMSKGKEPRPVTGDGAIATYKEMLLRSGAMGIYADFLLEDYSNSYSSIAKFATGPTVSTIDDAASIFWGAINAASDGKRQNTGRMFRFALNNTPFANTFYLRGGLDYFFLNDIQENLSPGFMAKQRNRLQKEGRSLLFEE